jgi:hypothetical protein
MIRVIEQQTVLITEDSLSLSNETPCFLSLDRAFLESHEKPSSPTQRAYLQCNYSAIAGLCSHGV